MNFCAIYTNPYNDDMRIRYYTDLFVIFLFLLVDKEVRYIFLDPRKKFDRLCQEVINGTEDFRINDIRIIKPKNRPGYEYLLKYKKYQDKDIPIGYYLICDESTKEEALNFFKPFYIIEMPKSKLYILADAPI